MTGSPIPTLNQPDTARWAAIRQARQNLPRHLDALKDFCGIPSISADPIRRDDVRRAAGWLAGRLQAMGLRQVEVFPTRVHPMVFGELPAGQPDRPTVLIYGHYDVQPEGPVDRWKSAPFTPAVSGDFLFARGAADMKGPLYATLAAVEAVLSQGPPPVNLKFILEGEEEIGSPSLGPFLVEHASLLAADACLNLDAGLLDYDCPTITYGLRGILAVELRVHGPSQDVHSGIFGGVIQNPAEVLVRLISALRGPDGRVSLPGFYDRVCPLEAAERAELARLPVTEASLLAQTGSPELWGEPGFSPVERIGARPTMEVNGLVSGCSGESFATIIPATALARISFRLVPGQDPDEIYARLIQFLGPLVPRTVRLEPKLLAGSPAVLVNRASRATRALEQALETAWEKRTFYQRGGGGIPVVTQMRSILGLESVLTGLAGPADNCHGPNERLHLPTFERGVETVIHFLHPFAQRI